MSNKLKAYFKLLVIIPILFSCKKNIGFISGINKLEVIEPQFEYLSAKGRMKLSLEGRNIGTSANFRMKKDSIIWVSIVPAFGIEAARVLVNQEQIKILDRINKKFYEYSFDEVSNHLGVKLSFQLMQSIVLGDLVVPYENQKILKDSSYYQYEKLEGKYKLSNFIGIKSTKLEKLIISQKESKNKIKVNYNEFKKVENEQIFPHTIFTDISYDQMNATNNSAKIYYSRIQIEEKALRFPFSVPNRYEKKKYR